MPARHRSNPLALAVLVCLAERPMHPYEAATTLRQRQKHESVRLNYGSLYAVVASLEKRKLIAPQETERKGRLPERTVYHLTGTGRIELHDWLTELLSTPVKDYTSFEAALSFLPALPPADVATLLRERAASWSGKSPRRTPRASWPRSSTSPAWPGWKRSIAPCCARPSWATSAHWPSRSPLARSKGSAGGNRSTAPRTTLPGTTAPRTTLPGTTLPGATAPRAPSSSPHGIRCVRAVSSINSRPGSTRTPASWRPGTSCRRQG